METTTNNPISKKQHVNESYCAFLNKYLKDFPDAQAWLVAYAIYVHAIDDIIDNEIPADKNTQRFILQTFEFSEVIYTHIFYISHISELRPLIKMAALDYMNSVWLEGETEKWKKHCSDHLRQTANAIVLAVIEICRGLDVKREASLELLRIGYEAHHDEQGNPI
jgi:hypothetical protein